MNRTKGVILFRNVLELMREAEYIDSNFQQFLEHSMSDYLYDNKKLGHSLESLFEYNKELTKDNLSLKVKNASIGDVVDEEV